MTFTAMLRRSSSVVPLAIRAVGRQRQIHNSALATVIKHSCGSRQMYRSSFPSRPSSDQRLIKVIESEIVCADNEAEPELDDIPDELAFEIVDIPGQKTITLEREYRNETISVKVQMKTVFIAEDEFFPGEDEENIAYDERSGECQVPLVVRIKKKSGPILEFDCRSFPDEIRIDELYYKDPNAPEDPYETPEFVDLDENLQKALRKYLEIRGIKPSALNFLHTYMIDKDNREYKKWLKNLKGFIEA